MPRSRARNGAPARRTPARTARRSRSKAVTNSGAAVDFDVLAYMAPGMALMFLMFTVSNGGRSLLAERSQGTLPRLLVSPHHHRRRCWAARCFGIFLTGVAQMLILIVASTLLFQLQLGRPAGCAGAGAGGGRRRGGLGHADHRPGARPPARSRRSARPSCSTFGILGGSFINLDNLPAWFRCGHQDHPQRLGPGWLHHPGAGRRAGRYPRADPGAAGDGRGAVRRIACFIINRRGFAQR